jgi:Prokaryotic E2 family E
MRKEFHLIEQDIEFLEAMKYQWETIIDNGNWVIINNYTVPKGYNLNETAAAIKIEPGYPTSQLDMVYFFPHLERSDGKGINALATHQIDGKRWQRWSRHRTSSNPWREEVDSLATHMEMVSNWLEREFKIR